MSFSQFSLSHPSVPWREDRMHESDDNDDTRLSHPRSFTSSPSSLPTYHVLSSSSLSSPLWFASHHCSLLPLPLSRCRGHTPFLPSRQPSSRSVFAVPRRFSWFLGGSRVCWIVLKFSNDVSVSNMTEFSNDVTVEAKLAALEEALNNLKEKHEAGKTREEVRSRNNTTCVKGIIFF